MIDPVLWGYVDPGSGMLLVQALIASVAGCLIFAWRIPGALWARVRRRGSGSQPQD